MTYALEHGVEKYFLANLKKMIGTLVVCAKIQVVPHRVQSKGKNLCSDCKQHLYMGKGLTDKRST